MEGASEGALETGSEGLVDGGIEGPEAAAEVEAAADIVTF